MNTTAHRVRDAIRWAGKSLACQHARVRIYRGRRARGKPLLEICPLEE